MTRIAASCRHSERLAKNPDKAAKQLGSEAAKRNLDAKMLRGIDAWSVTENMK